jgi:CRISPR-associated protein Cmr3
MSQWFVEPRDPLVVRDGRPNEGRSASGTLSFPFPGTLAGLVRTRLGSDEAGAFRLHDRLAELRAVSIRGPLLAELGATEDPASQSTLYVPAPRDALLTGEGTQRTVRRLHPIPIPSGALVDDALDGLSPVGLDEAPKDKPSRSPPAFWTWVQLERWLTSPKGGSSAWLDGAMSALGRESRVHVKIGETSTAEEGMLFQTTGLRFARMKEEDGLGTSHEERSLHDTRDFALRVDVDEGPLRGQHALRSGVGPAAGERRLVRWIDGSSAGAFPSAPDPLCEHVMSGAPNVRVRVVLLTPALFSDGWRPSPAGPLLAPLEGMTPSLAAAVVPRPETVSGWDFERGRPKRTRRLVSSGSVFWLDLKGSPEARTKWLNRVWMQNVSDQEQDQRDGYGLAVVGVA